MKPEHWEVYISRDRASGQTPWALVTHGKSKLHAQYAATVVIYVQSYTGLSSHKDRPMFVLHCFGILRMSGNVAYIEVPSA